MTATWIERARRATPLSGFARPRLPVAIAVLALVAVAGALVAAAAFERTYEGRILPGISVAGIDLAGASPEEARARLAGVAIEPAGLTLVVSSRAETVSAEQLGRRVDIEASVAAAMASGRGAGFLGDIGDRIALLQHGRTLELGIAIDDARLAAWIESAARRVGRAPVDARIVPTKDGWGATLAQRGAALDVPASTDLVRAALLGGVAGTPRMELPVQAVSPGSDDVEVAAALESANRMVADVRLTLDDKSWTIASKDLRPAVVFTWADGRPVPVLTTATIEAALKTIAAKVKVAPRETLLLARKSGGTFGYVPGAAGRSLDVPATTARVAELIEARGDGTATPSAVVTPVTIGVAPKMSAQQAAAIAPKVTRISSWTTRFAVSEKNGFGNNITIPARLINGTVVMPGQVFDFWRAVGPVTSSRGFRMGGIIQGGRTNPTGAIGGGICSASTTLFNAAIRAGYQVVERSPHYYYITRYPLGLDATVSKSGGVSTQNMRFRNDSSTPLYIRGVAGYGWVRFEIYSQPTGRSVTFSKPSVSNVRRAVDTVVRTSALRRGTSHRDETPASGMDVVVIRTVRDSRGAVIRTDRFVSHYKRVDGVVRVGTG